jgi:hypothetical protein
MVRARKAIIKAGWQSKVRLFMNVHDALEFYVHRSLNPADVIAVLQPAVIFEVPGWPMMKADWHVGKRWGSVKEIDLNSDGSIVIEGGPILHPRERYLPTLQTDLVVEEKEEEPIPQGKILTYTSTSEEETKTLVIEVAHMPTETQFNNLLRLLDRVPGSTPLELKTPEGTVALNTCGLDVQKHQNIVSMAMGGAQFYVKQDTSLLDLAELASDIVF